MTTTKTTTTRTIAVIGAAGATGGGLARAILADPGSGYDCRAITRTPESSAAQALADQGATVVRADLDDVDSLVAAFDGAYGAFCLTTFFEHFDAEREIAQAANLARAAAATGVHHAIWSTAEDTRERYPLADDRMPTLLGRFKVPQWDAKSEGDARFQEAGVPTTYLLTPFHWEAWVYGLGAPQRGPDGVLTTAMPLGDAHLLPGIAAEDIGRCAYGVFRAGAEFLGQTIGIAGEHTTGTRLAAGLARVYGEPVRYQPLPLDVFRSLPVPGIEVAANMFQYVAEANDDHRRRRDVRLARRLNPSLLDFDEWAAHTRAPARTG
jgi:uncharacterized protein YbjT (DUF2867 family)